MRRWPAGTLVLLGLLGLFAAAALLAPVLSPHDPLRQSLLLRLRPPGSADPRQGLFPLGTDDLGRDLLSRILFGARASFLVAGLSVAVSLLVGVALGLLAGWFGAAGRRRSSCAWWTRCCPSPRSCLRC